ncbi:MAG: hypothetical protein HDS26_04840 [Bacteroides sp.]|nr:hypothetical protein [Bacteroides sp.]
MEFYFNKPQSTYYNINQLVELSANLNTLQLRLLSTIHLLKYFLNVDSKKDWYQWVLDPSGFKIKKSEGVIDLSPEMRQTLTVFRPTIESEGDTIVDLDLEDKRQLMAVMTYMICFGSNPYLGTRYFKKVVISHDWEKRYWGPDRVFAYSDDTINSPDGYYQSRTIDLWSSLQKTELTSALKDYFSGDSGHTADDILPIVYGLISKLKTGLPGGIKMYLKDTFNDTVFLLTDGKLLVDPHYDVIGKATQKTESERVDIYLLNGSKYVWEVTTASGNRLDIRPNKEFPVRSGMSIAIPELGIVWKVEDRL